MTRLGEQDIVIGRMSANGYLKELEQVGLAKVHGSIGLGETYVGGSRRGGQGRGAGVDRHAAREAARRSSKANALSRLNDIDPSAPPTPHHRSHQTCRASPASRPTSWPRSAYC